MRIPSMLALVLLMSVPTLAQAPAVISDADVDAAILASTGGGSLWIAFPSCRTQLALFGGGYTAQVVGPMGRVALAAMEAHKKYQPFERANATAEMRAMTLMVGIEPDPPRLERRQWNITPAPTHIVLKPWKGKGGPVVQPLGIQFVDRSWTNAFGAQFAGRAAIATFDLRALSQLPPGDVEVTVVTEGREQGCKIKAKDRANIR